MPSYAAVQDREGLAEPAIGLLRQVLQRDKENVAGLYLLSRIYAQRNASEQSVEMLRQILDLDQGQSSARATSPQRTGLAWT